MSYNISQIATILHAKHSIVSPENTIDHLLTDSRRLSFPESSLFFALETPLRSGHDFIPELYENGVRNFIVNSWYLVPPTLLADANVIFVEDTLEALQLLAKNHREQFKIPVIGITGSNGKTVVKEWLNQLLGPDWTIVRTPRSFNSQIGVPLSVWEMKAGDNLGIFEAGISMPGEMDKLEKIIEPSIGLLTNIGAAHDEGFINRNDKLLEKIKLFQHCKTIVAPSIYVKDIYTTLKSYNAKLHTWGTDENDILQIDSIVSADNTTTITAKYDYTIRSITIPFTDDGATENAINCWCILLLLGVDDFTISERMFQLKAVDMRLQIVPALNNCTLINDSYSFDINSLNIALSFLRQQKIEKTVIISDLAFFDENNYKAIAGLLEKNHIDRVVAIGNTWQNLSYLLENKFKRLNIFSDVKNFLDNIQQLDFNREAILLKGARKYSFEIIARYLANSVHQTRLEISIPALAHNLQLYRKHIKPNTKIVAMVKAFAYGCGSIEVSTMAQYYKVDYLAVAYTDEGIALRNSGITLPIMVMNFDEEAFEALIKYKLEPNIFSFRIYHTFNHFLINKEISNYPIHFKIDTGMHRLGFEIDEIPEMVKNLNENNTMRVESCFSHFVASDDPKEDDFSNHQVAQFLNGTNILQQGLNYSFLKHIANTSGILRFPQYQFDMVRLGIGLYGIDSANILQDKLEEVATLITTIAQIHIVKSGETIGYNRKGKVNRDSRIATIRIGYADGLNRKLGNGNSSVYVKGQYAPIIGNICMDMTMIDITDIDCAQEGDSVEIFGKHISISELAKKIGTIPYEVLTSIGQRIKRIYIDE